MTVAVPPAGGGGSPGRSSGSGLADVIDTILDKGLVIDAYVRVSLVGIEILTIDVRVVVASVDTYLRFAEAVNRLDLASQKQGLPDLLSSAPQSVARGKTKGMVQGVLEAAGEKLQDMRESYADEPAPRARRRRREDD